MELFGTFGIFWAVLQFWNMYSLCAWFLQWPVVAQAWQCSWVSLHWAMEHGAMSPEYWPFSSIKTSLNFPYIPTLVNIFQIITYSNENFNKKYVWHIPTLYDMKGMILKIEKALIFQSLTRFLPERHPNSSRIRLLKFGSSMKLKQIYETISYYNVMMNTPRSNHWKKNWPDQMVIFATVGLFWAAICRSKDESWWGAWGSATRRWCGPTWCWCASTWNVCSISGGKP